MVCVSGVFYAVEASLDRYLGVLVAFADTAQTRDEIVDDAAVVVESLGDKGSFGFAAI